MDPAAENGPAPAPGTMAGIAPSALSPASASILGPFAPMIFG